MVEAKAEEKAAVAAKNTHPKPEKVDIEAPPAPHLIVRPRWDEEDTKQQIKCTLLSLDGLLDYNQDDVCEKVHPTPQTQCPQPYPQPQPSTPKHNPKS